MFLHAGETHLVPTATFPTNGAQQVVKSVDVTVKFAADVNPATLTASTFELRDAGNNLVPAVVSYDAATRTAKLNPNADFATTNNYYYAKVKGGVDGVKDTAGNTIDGDVQWSFTPGAPQFTEQTVFSGLEGPVAVQFAPDGRVFVAERSGLIKVFASTTATTPTVFADLRTQVHNFWDRGLLGMALAPNFPQQPYVYVLYTFDADVGGTAPKYGTAGVSSDPGPDATGNGALVSGRLSRLTVSNNGAGNTMVAGSEKVLINDWQQQFPSHSIGSLAFGPDGALYASAGDGASFNYADYGQTGNPFNDPVKEGGAVRSQDIRTPGDPTSLDGSIIRIDPATGLALPDNPYYAAGPDANAKRIVAHGFRNPFRFTFRPGTNEIWAGDVGWGTWEEIDRVQLGSSSVLNYGWPAYEGPNRQSGYDNLDLPVLEALYAAGPSAVVAPYYAYQHSEKVVAGSSEPTGGSSVSGVAFYNGGSYPAAYDGALFFADYSRKAIYVMYRGLDGLPDPSTRKVFKIDSSIGPAQLLTGPNGDLYYVDLANRAVKRFAFQSTNAPPTAVIAADKTTGVAPLTVQFSAAGSTDPNPGETLTYAWDLDGDGAYNDSTDVAPSFTYAATGTYTVRLRVTDRTGATGTASLAVSVGNSAPVPTITSPLAGLRWKVGDVISFAGGATDLQDGTLAAANLKWSLIVRHENLIDPSNYHEHLVQEWVGTSSGTFIAPDHEYPSKLELRLTATDSGGLTSTTAVVLLPQTSVFTVGANVPGVQVSFNGELATTPFNRTVIVGSANVVSAAGQAVGGTAYDFAGWSDGGAATHQVVAGAANGSLTATYTPSTALPVPWASADVGAVGLAGSAAYSNGTFTVRGAGADVWGTADSFRYAYQQVTGDATIVARVASIPAGAQGSAKFGVQFRNSLSADAANVQVDLEGDGTWGEFHARAAAAGATDTAPFFGVNAPRWLKLVRQGNAFTAYQSADGQAWAQVGQATVPMGQSVYVGLVVC
ncbi:MAG TPA: PQQ-dependent sugar dehydrogenase, partial [Humisphaera sp.]